MSFCGKCGNQLNWSSNFCPTCGDQVAAHTEVQRQNTPPPVPPIYSAQSGSAQGYYPNNFHPAPYASQPHKSLHPHHVAAGGFTQMFGLHPATAMLTVIANAMIFGGAGVAGLIAVPSGGSSLVVLTVISTVCGGILGIITYMAQKKWYDDDHESALIKSLIVAFLTAIPVGLPGFLALPAGIVGLFHRKKN